MCRRGPNRSSTWNDRLVTEVPSSDRVRGSLLGRAAGDALGAPIEFWDLAEIATGAGRTSSCVIGPRSARGIRSGTERCGHTVFVTTARANCRTARRDRR
ncbi:ADP-ribosylglycohydrolase family protein [Nocardia jiangsuensis]|uniref:ADP-ribosylglycohydrolase family protein n=1 Tax=Nocardia jiangsuensis TaxID=1691563 RepID=A0ABV8DNR7_9NOCA